MRVYVGTYSRDCSRELHTFEYDPDSGKLEHVAVVDEVANPAFLAREPSGRFIYAVSEVSSLGGQPTGGVAAFAVEPSDGRLRFLNLQSSMGPGPCHICVDRAGQFALVSNYRGESIAMLPILPDGSLGPAIEYIEYRGSSVHPIRQTQSHPHSCVLDATNRWVFVADLGADRIMLYELDSVRGRLQPHSPPWVSVRPGSGPRHFAFHPGGNFAYVINEIGNSVTAFSFKQDLGTLDEIQTLSTLPEGYQEQNITADIHVAPSGRFAYGSNRGHDSIVIYDIDPLSGRLSLVGHESTCGKWPRNFATDPQGRHLLVANQYTNTIVSFLIDTDKGFLTGTEHVVGISNPVCILFNPR